MNAIILATMLFVTVPTVEQNVTVYAEPSAVEYVDASYSDVYDEEYDVISCQCEDEYTDTIEDMDCTHGSFTDIIHLGDGVYEGICECGESILWVEDEEEEYEEDEDEEIPADEDDDCLWIDNGDGTLTCSVHGCMAVVDDMEDTEND